MVRDGADGPGSDDDSRDDLTELAPAYEAADGPPKDFDPWTDLTPVDADEIAVVEKGEAPRLPGFADETPDFDPEITGRDELEMVTDFTRALGEDPAATWVADASVADDEVPTYTLTPSPEPPEPEEPESGFEGDGPFAAPMDSPSRPTRGAARFTDALRSDAGAELMVTPAPPPPAPPVVPSEVRAELHKPLKIERRSTVTVEPTTTAGHLRRSRPSIPVVAAASEPTMVRHYPKARALLADPDSVPYGIAPPTEPPAPPVPGTFFPMRPEPTGQPSALDLDRLLLTMAEGLLVGEDGDGGTEIRVTLRDEFFAGTELRISIADGRVHATLVPPDRDIYWQLNGHVGDLESRLSERGLRVQGIEVLEPGS